MERMILKLILKKHPHRFDEIGKPWGEELLPMTIVSKVSCEVNRMITLFYGKRNCISKKTVLSPVCFSICGDDEKKRRWASFFFRRSETHPLTL
jgi:hypothetical protein